MGNLPFSMQSAAATWIMERLQLCGEQAETAGLVPGLYFFLDEKCRDEGGRIFEWCPHSFFDIGWDRPENAAARGYVELDLLGRKVFTPLSTLKRLEGKQLVLETVEVGFPTPADKKRQLLRAASKKGKTREVGSECH